MPVKQFQKDCVREVEAFGCRALMSFPMGSGKTMMALHALRRGNLFPAVIVCPASVKLHWEHEALAHIGIRASVLDGLSPPPGKLRTKPKLLILNYDILGGRTLTREDGSLKKLAGWVKWLRKLGLRAVVLDEHQYVANRGTIRTKAAQALCKDVPHIIAPSGTPLLNRPAELWVTLNIVAPEEFPSWHAFAHRYCLPPDAPILMGNLKEKPISEIKVGDTVIGFANPEGRRRRLVKSKVLRVLTKHAPLQRVLLEDGTELICTPDHRWATGASENKQERAYREAIAGRAGGRGNGCASRVMKVFRGTAPIYSPEDEDYQRGYIHGFFRGDGHCTKKRTARHNHFKKTTAYLKTTHRVGCACMDRQPVERVSRYLDSFAIPHRKDIRSDGLHYIGRLDNKTGYRFISKETAERDSDAWWAGFLGGIYDAEGSGTSIAQYELANPITFDMIERGLRRFSFRYHTGVARECVSIKGGRLEFLRFWNVANPALRRKLCKLVLSAGGRLGGGASTGNPWTTKGTPFVSNIEPLPGIHTTYTLTTETGNYVAYGCGSKNCGPKKTPWGWQFKGASNLDELHQKMTRVCMVRRLKSEVLADLPDKVHETVLLPLSRPAEYAEARDDFRAWLEKQGEGKARAARRAIGVAKVGYLLRLVAKLKLKAVVEWVNNWLANTEDEKMVLFAVHRRMVEILQERCAAGSVKIYGGIPHRMRKLAVQQFRQDRDCRLLIGNYQAAGVGLDGLQVAQSVGLAELPWRPGDVSQAESRVHRMGQQGRSWVYNLIAAGTIEDALCRTLARKQRVLSQTLDGEAAGDDVDVFDSLVKAVEGGFGMKGAQCIR